jgi:hypothetical protein
LWRRAFEEADFIYYRFYAQWRMAEALLNTEEVDDGAKELQAVFRESKRIGTQLLVDRAKATATTHDIGLV